MRVNTAFLRLLGCSIFPFDAVIDAVENFWTGKSKKSLLSLCKNDKINSTNHEHTELGKGEVNES